MRRVLLHRDGVRVPGSETLEQGQSRGWLTAVPQSHEGVPMSD